MRTCNDPIAATGTLTNRDRVQQPMPLHARSQRINRVRLERPKALYGNIDA